MTNTVFPFDLMIGVNRGVYADGVYQGQDLYDSRVSLIQYRELFNSFPQVKFPISVLASVTNQELVSYAWIFPNVITNGHWWYSNTPSFIARDAAARLEAVPQTKQIAYYSDAYKLEFVWPKFDMYRRVLSGILADHFVKQCGWSEERAIELGRQVLRDNVDEIFPRPPRPDSTTQVDPLAETWSNAATVADLDSVDQGEAGVLVEDEPSREAIPDASAASGTSAALAAGAIGMVEVQDSEPLAETEPAAGAREDHGFSTVIETASDAEPAAEETAAEQAAGADDEQEVGFETIIESSDAGADVELDPLPSADEIQAVGVEDVQLLDMASETLPDAETIEAESEAEPLDVGELFGDTESPEQPADEIRLLRGEESFEPDEDSLQLQPDPVTGELTFPVPSSSSEQAAPAAEATDDLAEPAEDELVMEEIEEISFDAGPTLEAGAIEETLEIEEFVEELPNEESEQPEP